MVLAACGADRKAAADGMRAIIDESGGAVGWRATGSASRPQQLDLAIDAAVECFWTRTFNVLAFANLSCEIGGLNDRFWLCSRQHRGSVTSAPHKRGCYVFDHYGA
jgi:hypothetical protein